ncbi:hypothetical protein [uncultured Formosa sp.]|uniref:hypothetical protein n=1 Tax=uncultured Formosa sp. TaxID=255435 RepID=UPI00261E2134|nr:hypothetical protein [uncultured Formosa sp.]
MRNLLRLLVCCIVIFIFSGCEIDHNEETYPYYKFESEDDTLLIKYNYIPNQIITYKNQFNKKLNFRVISNITEKRGSYSRGTFSGGGGLLVNYYDSKIIRLEIIENPSNTSNSGDYSKVNYVFSKNKSVFVNGFNFPMWNITSFYSINELQDNVNVYLSDFNEIPKTEMSINNHVFKAVVVIDSNSDESLNNSSFGPLLQNVNKIFYDYDFGIVQFNDVDGNEWKVIYPE